MNKTKVIISASVEVERMASRHRSMQSLLADSKIVEMHKMEMVRRQAFHILYDDEIISKLFKFPNNDGNSGLKLVVPQEIQDEKQLLAGVQLVVSNDYESDKKMEQLNLILKKNQERVDAHTAFLHKQLLSQMSHLKESKEEEAHIKLLASSKEEVKLLEAEIQAKENSRNEFVSTQTAKLNTLKRGIQINQAVVNKLVEECEELQKNISNVQAKIIEEERKFAPIYNLAKDDIVIGTRQKCLQASRSVPDNFIKRAVLITNNTTPEAAFGWITTNEDKVDSPFDPIQFYNDLMRVH